MSVFHDFVIQPFVDGVDIHGSRNAFCINETFYTYADFAKTISAIQVPLQPLSAQNIGLVVNDDLETYASIFAIWLTGHAFVPLHPHQPLERSNEIIEQAEITLVLDSEGTFASEQINLLATRKLEVSGPTLASNAIPEDSLAYILFTSGSTGKPKGVQITRANVGSFLKAFWATGVTITEEDRCLQCFDLTFDVSVQSYLAPIVKGACLYTVPHDQIKFSYISGLLDDHELTFGAMAPSMIRYLRPYFDEVDVPSMRINILTAEASPLDLIEEWSNCVPNAQIYNFYGPTEATIYCTYQSFHRDTKNKELNGMLSIGKPLPGMRALVIDGEGNILGKNQKGELCISGDQITPGYWKNEDKNATSFFHMELDGVSTRFYKTGDSCYWDDEGELMLSGRIDHQVKIQGYRIELGEVEFHAREFLKGQNAVASAFTNQVGNTEIALFIEGELSEESDLKSYMSTKMPHYMMPTKWIVKKTFPVNTSGKVDRIRLKDDLKNV